MKQILFIITIYIFGFSFGQIKEIEDTKKELIGEHKEMGSQIIKLERWNDDEIVFIYKDMLFTQVTEYKSFDFKDVDGAFDLLYNKLRDGIDKEEKSESSLDLTNYILRLNFDKTMGKGYVEIFVQNKNTPSIIGKIMWMDAKRLNKVFGKEEPKKEKKKK